MNTKRDFDPVRNAPRQARQFVSSLIPDVPAQIREDVSLMVSELAANALVHAASEFEVSVRRTPTTVRVEVRDAAGGQPRIAPPSLTRPSGRGLAIVDHLADQWGTRKLKNGKVVWFSVRLDGQSGNR